ncbi:MAG TPA: BatD family protein, partial [Flavitalea sp.]|nr:BatD family protein [Flavitalea sp.]
MFYQQAGNSIFVSLMCLKHCSPLNFIVRLILLSVSFISIRASAQVKFYSLVSENNLTYNQTFQVQYVIEGTAKVQRFEVPDFHDFQLEEVFDLPTTPSLDPKTMKLVDQRSKIVVLTPIKTGVFVIPGATAIVDGKKIKSNSIRVNIRASSLSRISPDAVNAGRVEDASELKEGENLEEKIQNNFFVLADVSKTICYVGEPVMATYKAYSRVNANSHVVRRPAFTGFSVIEMVDGYEGNPSVEEYRGEYFYVHLVRKVQLFPLQPGSYELDPAEIEGTIHLVKENPTGRFPPYAPFDHEVLIRTKPVEIKV